MAAEKCGAVYSAVLMSRFPRAPRVANVALGLSLLLLVEGVVLPGSVVSAAKDRVEEQAQPVAEAVVCAQGFTDVDTKTEMSLHGVTLVPKGALAVGYSRRSIPGQPPQPPIPLDLTAPWRTALKRAEITDFRWHDLRHSAASYLAMNGASLAEIAEVLGHKTLAMVKRYAHLSEAHTAAVVERMNAAIFPA